MPRGISKNPEVTRAQMRARVPWNKGNNQFIGLLCPCGNTFDHWRQKKYCSPQCRKANWIPWNRGMKGFGAGRIVSEETRRKIGLLHKGFRHSEETKQRLSNHFKGLHTSPETEFKKGSVGLRKGAKHTPETREKMRIRMVESPNRIYRDTSIERAIETELSQRGIHFLKQIPLARIAKVDFFLPEYRIVIQCDGCFYHGCPTHFPNWTRNKERDHLQDVVLAFSGYRVFRFWEHEINESPPRCIDEAFGIRERSGSTNKIITTQQCQSR